MGQKDTPRQPSSLERLQQARKDKEMGIFRKTKKVPEKKPTRVAEFEFYPKWVVPGGVIHYRQSGKMIISMQEEIIRMMKDMPITKYIPPQPNPFFDWRKTGDDAKLEEKTERPKETATESWAEKWARENQ